LVREADKRHFVFCLSIIANTLAADARWNLCRQASEKRQAGDTNVRTNVKRTRMA